MLAGDSSTVVAYLAGDTGDDVNLFVRCLQNNEIVLSPVVITELLSARNITSALVAILRDVETLNVLPGFWERAGEQRRKLRLQGLKAHLPDALIAQSCIDHDIPLITRDEDFRHYAKHCGLKLAKR